MILHAVVHVFQVIIQAAALNELLPADVARVRLLARVRAHVGPVALPRAELLVAKFTDHRRAGAGGLLELGLLGVLIQIFVRLTHFFRAT